MTALLGVSLTQLVLLALATAFILLMCWAAVAVIKMSMSQPPLNSQVRSTQRLGINN